MPRRRAQRSRHPSPTPLDPGTAQAAGSRHASLPSPLEGGAGEWRGCGGQDRGRQGRAPAGEGERRRQERGVPRSPRPLQRTRLPSPSEREGAGGEGAPSGRVPAARTVDFPDSPRNFTYWDRRNESAPARSASAVRPPPPPFDRGTRHARPQPPRTRPLHPDAPTGHCPLPLPHGSGIKSLAARAELLRALARYCANAVSYDARSAIARTQ
jgi:hypothetical protein